MPRLDQARILIIATDGFEESELFGPRRIFQEAGAEVVVAAPNRTPIQATVRDDPGRVIRPHMTIAEATADDFNALVIPGGVLNPDALRCHRPAVDLIRAFDAANKPIGAICHGPWLLVEADLLRGRRAACWPSMATDVRNAGAILGEDSTVVDGHLVTSRSPDDVDDFANALIALIETG